MKIAGVRSTEQSGIIGVKRPFDTYLILYKLKTERKRKENGGMMKAFLILEDGHVFTGTSIGSPD